MAARGCTTISSSKFFLIRGDFCTLMGVVSLSKYHDYANTLGSKYIKPDLAIAFNAGFLEESQESWRPAINFLVQNKVPSAFTVCFVALSMFEFSIVKQ